MSRWLAMSPTGRGVSATSWRMTRRCDSASALRAASGFTGCLPLWLPAEEGGQPLGDWGVGGDRQRRADAGRPGVRGEGLLREAQDVRGEPPVQIGRLAGR